MKAKRCIRVIAPLIGISIVCIIIAWKYVPATMIIPRIDFVLSALITCSSTFTGFILTVVSVLLGFSKTNLVQYLNKHGGTKELVMRYTITIVLGILLILLCVCLGSIIPENHTIGKWWVSFTAIMTIAYGYSLISSGYYLLRTISLAVTTVTIVEDEPVKPTGKYRI